MVQKKQFAKGLPWVVIFKFPLHPKVYGPYRKQTAERIAELMRPQFPDILITPVELREDPTREL